MSCNKLLEIPWNNIIKLRNLYKENWQKNYLGYYTLNNFVRRYNIESDNIIKYVKLYCLNGEWEDDGTFIIIENYQIFFNTINHKSYQRLQTALSLLDLSQSYIFSGFSQSLLPVIEQLIQIKNINLSIHPLDTCTLCYYLPRTEANKFDICSPQGIYLRNLNEIDAKMINEFWGWRHKRSLDLVINQIKFNVNLGAYTDFDELVGWCIRAQPGSLAALYVKEEYRRYGLGSLLVKGIAKILAGCDEDCYATVLKDNYPSRSLFEKLGFQNNEKLYWRVIGDGKEF